MQANQAPIPAAPHQQVAAGFPTAQQSPGPGRLLAAIDCVGGGKDEAAVMQRKLKMQLLSESDWKGFKVDILSSLELQIFRYMVEGSPFINMLHS